LSTKENIEIDPNSGNPTVWVRVNKDETVDRSPLSSQNLATQGDSDRSLVAHLTEETLLYTVRQWNWQFACLTLLKKVRNS